MSRSAQEYYLKNIELYQQKSKEWKKKSSWFANFRLISIVISFLFLYFYFSQNSTTFIYFAVLFIFLFLYLIKKHLFSQKKFQFFEALLRINQTEYNFLENNESPFPCGQEFIDPKNAYTFDLDIFGKGSLFQHLNRTETQVGKMRLAALLEQNHFIKNIEEHQKAIQELREKSEWRQAFTAHAQLSHDSPAVFQQLTQWSKQDIPTTIKGIYNLLAIINPIITIGLIIAYFSFPIPNIQIYLTVIIFANLMISNRAKGLYKAQFISIHEIDSIITDYSNILKNIQETTFESPYLQKVQIDLQQKQAAQQFVVLSNILKRVDTIQNIFGAIILNGIFLYHIQTIKKMLKWRQSNNQYFINFLHQIGEIEALNSLSNFSFNNPEYCYPSFNQNFRLSFSDLGHPLIDSHKRINNSVLFDQQRFIILTGSNMAGKSTFLRSLGVNMVLANIGAPICAKEANIHSLPIYVSMRQSDSLNEQESYFFAEVKRLQYIMNQLKTQACFLLLDEILRGTNSEDKRNGTLGVINKIIEYNGIGVIATHDLDVCQITYQYPSILKNMRFEAQIVNNELYFNYKLQNGICENKSATFLMKKLDIIS